MYYAQNTLKTGYHYYKFHSFQRCDTLIVQEFSRIPSKTVKMLKNMDGQNVHIQNIKQCTFMPTWAVN